MLKVSKPPYMPGQTVQVVNIQTGEVAVGAVEMVFDDSIPINTEGNEFMTLAITPKYANSKLKIEVVWIGSHNAAAPTKMMVALFQDAIVAALASVILQLSTARMNSTTFNHFMIAGSVSPITFKVRAGSDSNGITTFNGLTSTRKLGGSLASSITITEIKE